MVYNVYDTHAARITSDYMFVYLCREMCGKPPWRSYPLNWSNQVPVFMSAFTNTAATTTSKNKKKKEKKKKNLCTQCCTQKKHSWHKSFGRQCFRSPGVESVRSLLTSLQEPIHLTCCHQSIYSNMAVSKDDENRVNTTSSFMTGGRSVQPGQPGECTKKVVGGR